MKELDYLKKQYKMLDNKMDSAPAYKKVIGAVLTAGLTACAYKTVIAPTISAEPNTNPNNSSEFTPTPEVVDVTTGKLSIITNEKEKTDLIASLPANRPESTGDIKDTDVFNIQVGDKQFTSIMYPVIPETVILSKNPDGTENKTVQSIAMYTEYVDVQGKKSWVRLFAVNPYKDRQVTNWMYDPNGMPKENIQAEVNRPVLGYEIDPETNRLDIIMFQPLVVQPDYVRGYDNSKPVNVSIIGEEPSGMKVQAMIAEVKIKPIVTPIPFEQMTDEQKLASAPIVGGLRNEFYSGKTNQVLRKDINGVVKEIYKVDIKETIQIPEGYTFFDINQFPNMKSFQDYSYKRCTNSNYKLGDIKEAELIEKSFDLPDKFFWENQNLPYYASFAGINEIKCARIMYSTTPEFEGQGNTGIWGGWEGTVKIAYLTSLTGDADKFIYIP